MRTYATIKHLADRWAGADRQLLRQVFPLLAEGQPVEIDRIAERTGTSITLVENALVEGRAGRDAAGRVVDLSGLMLSPTMHRVEIDGVALFSCCALLSHLTPFLLDRAVRLESVDPMSRGVIRFELNPTTVESVTPAGAVGSFVETDKPGLAADVGAAFCSHVHHFTHRESATVYAAYDARRYVVEIEELRAAAEELYSMAWA